MIAKFLPCILLYSGVLFKAQVGINTNSPKADLHIVGDLQVTKDIKPGGSATLPGDPGESGDILISQGIGLAPVWKSVEELNIPIESTLREKKLSSISVFGNPLTVTYDTSLRDRANYLVYNNLTGGFTVAKAGFYDVTTYLRYSILAISPAGTSVTTIKKNGAKVVASSTSHLLGTTSIHHNVTKISLFAVGDVITIEGDYSQPFTLTNSSISFMYLGN